MLTESSQGWKKKRRDGSRSPEDKTAAAIARPLWDAEYEMANMPTDGRRLSDVEGEQVRPGAEEEGDEDEDEEGDDGADEEEAPFAHQRSRIQSYKSYTPDEEARVRRKLDTRLVLFVALLYMLAFLDRSNIGL